MAWGALTEAADTWFDYVDLPMECVDTPILRQRTWGIAAQYQLLTLYDAALLACTETVLASSTPCARSGPTSGSSSPALTCRAPRIFVISGNIYLLMLRREGCTKGG